jgi:hypothetical protein
MTPERGPHGRPLWGPTYYLQVAHSPYFTICMERGHRGGHSHSCCHDKLRKRTSREVRAHAFKQTPLLFVGPYKSQSIILEPGEHADFFFSGLWQREIDFLVSTCGMRKTIYVHGYQGKAIPSCGDLFLWRISCLWMVHSLVYRGSCVCYSCPQNFSVQSYEHVYVCAIVRHQMILPTITFDDEVHMCICASLRNVDMHVYPIHACRHTYVHIHIHTHTHTHTHGRINLSDGVQNTEILWVFQRVIADVSS